MALHTELPIYRTGVRLLDLAVKAQVQMPRTVKRVLGEKITQHCVEMLDLMALANAGARHVETGAAFRLDGAGIHAVRSVLEDYSAMLETLSERTMTECHRLTERRGHEILRGVRQPHDVVVTAI